MCFYRRNETHTKIRERTIRLSEKKLNLIEKLDFFLKILNENALDDFFDYFNEGDLNEGKWNLIFIENFEDFTLWTSNT